MSTGETITAGPPSAQPAAPASSPGRGRDYLVAVAFLAPATIFLGVWIVYPTIRTIIRSFYDRSGDEFVWFENYERMFTTEVLQTAIKNNAIWVLVVPALVTAIG
ncbi:MAG TPA: hypothetical protein VFR43_01930, partial [Gaiellaceae bacterium]|nr:hypothetical protein [Gaiellaceae bacterium]